MLTYQPLEDYLNNLDIDLITLTFIEVETILDRDLPASAYNYTAWWSNDITHVQAVWLNAGWKTRYVNANLPEEIVTFVKQPD